MAKTASISGGGFSPVRSSALLSRVAPSARNVVAADRGVQGLHPRDRGHRTQVLVVTGGSGGLGQAAARHLAEAGTRLVLGARRLERLQALAREPSLPEGAVVRTEVTRVDEVRRLVDRAVESHGRADMLLDDAGSMPLSAEPCLEAYGQRVRVDRP